MRIYILSQEEPFYLPKFYKKLVKNLPKDFKIIGGTFFEPFNSQNSWFGVIKDHLNYYGFYVFIKQGLRFTFLKFINFLKLHYFTDNFYSSKSLFKSHEIPLYKAENINSKKFINHLKDLEIDIIVSIACPKILKKELINFPEFGCINFHSGKLPAYRGIAPLFWAMMNNEKEAGITIHYINEKIDDGKIINQDMFNINEKDSLHKLYKKVTDLGPNLLIKSLIEIKNNELSLKDNDSNKGSYFGFPSSEDGKKFRKKGKRFR